MFNFFVILYIIVLSILSYLFCHIVFTKNIKNDLLFFIIANYILSFSLWCFLFYFNDYLFSAINIFLLLINTIFLSYEIRITYNKYKFFYMPYLIYIVFLFYLIIDLFLMHL